MLTLLGFPSEELFTKENYWIIFVPEQILD